MFNDIDSYLKECWERVESYIDGVSSGEILANNYIKQVVSNYKKEVLSQKWDYIPDKVDDVFRFCYFININIDNKYRQFVPSKWQAFFIAYLFGFYDQKGERRVNTVYLLIAKKNGKSVLSSILQLYFLIADGIEDPQSVLVANTREQAGINLKYISDIIYNSPALLDNLEVNNYKVSFKERIFKGVKRKKSGFCKTLSSNAKRLNGYNISSAILDEIGAMENEDLYNVVKSSTVNRKNPMVVIISTAYPSLTSYGCELFERGKQILNPECEMKDDSFLYFLYTLDEGDDFTDPNLWIKSNPSLGDTLQLDRLVKDFNSAKNSVTNLSSFLTLNLNLFTGTLQNNWTTVDNDMSSINIDELKDYDMFGGLDLSATKDLASFTLFIPTEDKLYFKTHYFFPNQPEKRIRPNGKDLLPWINDGFIHPSQKPAIDYEMIYDVIREYVSKYNIVAIGIDPWGATEIINKLTEILSNGTETVVKIPQTSASFTPVMKKFEVMQCEKRVVIDENPVTAWNFNNCGVEIYDNNNCKPKKNKNKDSIDGVISILTAMAVLDKLLKEKLYIGLSS